nr:unnamed protein product [Callosobruchus analis]
MSRQKKRGKSLQNASKMIGDYQTALEALMENTLQ